MASDILRLSFLSDQYRAEASGKTIIAGVFSIFVLLTRKLLHGTEHFLVHQEHSVHGQTLEILVLMLVLCFHGSIEEVAGFQDWHTKALTQSYDCT